MRAADRPEAQGAIGNGLEPVDERLRRAGPCRWKREASPFFGDGIPGILPAHHPGSLDDFAVVPLDLARLYAASTTDLVDAAVFAIDAALGTAWARAGFEIAGWIGYFGEDLDLMYTRNFGDEFESSPGPIPMGMNVIGSYHIHTDAFANYLSDQDYYTAQEIGLPHFLGVAGGFVLQYNPVRHGLFPGTTHVIREDRL